MDVVECKDETEWVDAINSWLKTQIELYHPKRLFLPAGESPRPLYRNWERFGAPFSSELRLVQLDEIITGVKQNAFRHFFEETLPSYQQQFDYIEGAEEGADLAILGLGANGHVAFHEPGLSPRFYSGCLILNPETIKRSQLYEGVKVVTYGVEAFLRAKAILMIVRGEAKRAIFQEVLRSACELPAAKLKVHAHFTIMTDF